MQKLLATAFLVSVLAGAVTDGETITVDCGGGVTMELVKIPSGSFMMGTDLSDYSAASQARPVHQVTIDYDFYMGTYEVTQAQCQAVMGSNPSVHTGDGALPVENVSWSNALAFCQALANRSGYAVRLPSEAEWEYSCKAGGGDTHWYFGNDVSQLADHAWFYENASSTTHPVGQKLPNAFGLYDLYGNAWEWCQDLWHDDYTDAPTDGRAWTSGSSAYRVGRGGGIGATADGCSSWYRGQHFPEDSLSSLGFRVVCSAVPEPASLLIFCLGLLALVWRRS